MNPQTPSQGSQQQAPVLLNGHSSPHFWEHLQNIQDEKNRAQHAAAAAAAAKGHSLNVKSSYQQLFQQEYASRNEFRTTGSPVFNQSMQLAGQPMNNRVAHLQNPKDQRLKPCPNDMRFMPQQTTLEAVSTKEGSNNLPPSKKIDIAQSLLSLHSGIREPHNIGDHSSGGNATQLQMIAQQAAGNDPHSLAAKGNQWKSMFDPSSMQPSGKSGSKLAKDTAVSSTRTPNYHMQNEQQVATSVAMETSQSGRYEQSVHRSHIYQQPGMDPNYRGHSALHNSRPVLPPNRNTDHHPQHRGHINSKFLQNSVAPFHERFPGEIPMNPIMSMEILSNEMTKDQNVKTSQRGVAMVEQSIKTSAAMITPEQPGKLQPCNSTAISMETPLQSASKATVSIASGSNHPGAMDTSTAMSSVEKLEHTKTKISKSKSRSETPKLSGVIQANHAQMFASASAQELAKLSKQSEKSKECISAEIALKASLRHPRLSKRIESAHTLDLPKPLQTPLGPPVLNTRPSKMVTIATKTPPRTPPPTEVQEKPEEKPETEMKENNTKSLDAQAIVEQEYEHWKMTKMLEEDAKVLPPECDCGEVEKDDAPYYTHLGSGPTINAKKKKVPTATLR